LNAIFPELATLNRKRSATLGGSSTAIPG